MRSQGLGIAKSHGSDWITLVLLFALVGVLNLINPFHRYVGRIDINDLKYPLHGVTFPMWAVPVVAVLFPIIVFLIFYKRRRDAYDLHHAILGLLFSIVLSAVVTDVLKDAVGRPRPHFFWRCFPDGSEAYDPVTGNVVCHGEPGSVKQGYKSFPSGHTSWSFAGLTFLSLYLAGKIKAFDTKGHVAKLCVVLFPLLAASVIGISLVDDYWHHWQDVVVGGLIGIVMATICYHQFFPAPFHKDGCRTHAYLRMMEERGAAGSAVPVDVENPQEVERGSLSSAQNGATAAACDDVRQDLEMGRS